MSLASSLPLGETMYQNPALEMFKIRNCLIAFGASWLVSFIFLFFTPDEEFNSVLVMSLIIAFIFTIVIGAKTKFDW